MKGNVIQQFIKVQGETVNFGGQNTSEVARSSSKNEETFESGSEVSFIKAESKIYKYLYFLLLELYLLSLSILYVYAQNI